MLAIRFLSVLALLFVAFAHKPINHIPTDDFQLAQYVLPDGSYPVFCITDRATDIDGADHENHLYNNSCEACRISSALYCPAPAHSTGAAPHIAMANGAVLPQPILHRNIYPPSAPPHAPPVS